MTWSCCHSILQDDYWKAQNCSYKTQHRRGWGCQWHGVDLFSLQSSQINLEERAANTIPRDNAAAEAEGLPYLKHRFPPWFSSLLCGFSSSMKVIPQLNKAEKCLQALFVGGAVSHASNSPALLELQEDWSWRKNASGEEEEEQSCPSTLAAPQLQHHYDKQAKSKRPFTHHFKLQTSPSSSCYN